MANTRRPTKAELRRERAEAARLALAKAQQRQRRIRIGLWSGAGVVVVAAIVIVVLLVTRSPAPPSGAAASPTPTATANIATSGRMTNPPWATPADAGAAVAAAGLPMLGAEGTALHIHTHLDVFANGAKVTVPPEIGIDLATNQISPLHSHDETGVIHVESNVATATYTLGQFFAEWEVSLAADHIGGLKADSTHHLRVFVNGKERPGDPAAIVLAAHDEIAIYYGTDAQVTNVPNSYAWTNGL